MVLSIYQVRVFDMEVIQNRPRHFLVKYLIDYLIQTRFSLSQVALKLNVSKGHLSDIKNGRVLPGIELGLRILKQCNVSIADRKLWTDLHNHHFSEEYREIWDYYNKNGAVEKLNREIAQLFVDDILLFNLYLTIINSAQGIPTAQIKENYGAYYLDKINFLKKSNLLSIENELVSVTDKFLIFNTESSFKLMNKLFLNFLDEYKKGQRTSQLNFLIDDLNPEVEKELNLLFDSFNKKLEQLFKDNQMEIKKGGKRFIGQVLIGKLLFPLILSLTLGLWNSLEASSGGAGGGTPRNGNSITWPDIFSITNNYESELPRIKFHTEEGTLRIDYKDLCYNPDIDMIQTKRKFEICLERKVSVFDNQPCLQKERSPLTRSLIDIHETCIDDECDEVYKEERIIPLFLENVVVYKTYTRGGETQKRPFSEFLMDYTMPSCQRDPYTRAQKDQDPLSRYD